MSPTSTATIWWRRAAVIALVLVGFFLVGRTITNDETTDPVAPGGGADRPDELPAPTQLTLAKRIPNLIAPKPRGQKPTPAHTTDSAPEAPAAAPPTEERPAPTPVETSVPPPPVPAAPPPDEPAPSPEPPPQSEPQPEPEPPAPFDDSG